MVMWSERFARPQNCYFPKEVVENLVIESPEEAATRIHECPLWSIACFRCEAQEDRRKLEGKK